MAVHKTQVTVKYALIFNVTSFSFQFFQMEHGVRLRPSLQFFTQYNYNSQFCDSTSALNHFPCPICGHFSQDKNLSCGPTTSCISYAYNSLLSIHLSDVLLTALHTNFWMRVTIVQLVLFQHFCTFLQKKNKIQRDKVYLLLFHCI